MSAVQHARPAARPAGRQLRSPGANTAASAWDRAPGVADCRTTVQKHQPMAHPLICTGTLCYESVDRAEETGVIAQLLTKTVNLRPSSPLLSWHLFTRGLPD